MASLYVGGLEQKGGRERVFGRKGLFTRRPRKRRQQKENSGCEKREERKAGFSRRLT